MVLRSMFFIGITLLVVLSFTQYSSAQNITTASAVNATANPVPATNKPGSSNPVVNPSQDDTGAVAILPNIVCTNVTNCTDTNSYKNSICADINNTLLCACKLGWKLIDKACIQQAVYGDVCTAETSNCTQSNTKCDYSGANNGIKRCQCMDGFKEYKDPNDNNTKKCVQILTQDKVPECKTCEGNDGTCISENQNGTKSGCVCPVSRIGPDCETILVNVTCDVQNFRMIVCYDPQHDGVNFTAGSRMYANGYGTNPACRGTVVAQNDTTAQCQPGQVQLILYLAAALRQTCGTDEVEADVTTKKFTTKILVEKDPSTPGSGSVAFMTYCSFLTQKNTAFSGVGVNVNPGNDRGESKYPNMGFNIYDITGRAIPKGTTMNYKDIVTFQISMQLDGTYESLLVERCTASTSAIIPDPKAITAALIMKSCPVPSQTVFTTGNMWRRVAKQTNVLTTGNIRLWRMPQGNTIFLHCTVRLCLKNKPKDCELVKCNGILGAGRRKRREVEGENEVDLTREIILYDDAAQNSGKVVLNKVDFGLLMTVLIVLLVVFIVLAVLLFLRYRSRGPRVEAFGEPNKPQRFAMPRINTPSMRM